MTPDRLEGKAETDTPAGILRHWEFDGGRVSVLARQAIFIEGSPDQLYLFGAHEVTIADQDIKPPQAYDDSSEWSSIFGYYTGNETKTIIIFLGTWSWAHPEDVAGSLAITELHELTHWAVPEEDNEQDPSHWDRWNATLTEAVEYALEIDEWPCLEGYNPPTVESKTDEQTTEQITLEEIE
ncbi:hypothetical protein SAMN05216388_10471 [Halorientalis persicus]|uniref:Uncharacterized protein n=1 Tax=Halorientalis persicus TaxID=1367881 RepID=A0A1H8W3H0_9EURY|nr:hypothetical protein [Halorientalis persicus]SEP22083.1 hypothetical protein SAMN05216388_10471 [Halorientalis persicus]